MKLKTTKIYPVYRYLRAKMPASMRFGAVYPKTQELIQQSEKWRVDQVERYQLNALNRLIRFADQNVPYYQKLFKKIDFHPDDLKQLSDVRQIPFLTKDIINEKREQLVAVNFPKKYLGYATTGGSTGIPMGFHSDTRIAGGSEMAYMLSQWERVGYKWGRRMIRLRGDVVRNIEDGKRYWEMDRYHNALVMSSYHLTDQTIPIYIDKMRKYNPEFFHPYPSALTLIAKYMKRHRMAPFKKLRAIFLGSENVYDWQRALFEEFFQTRVYSWYGHSERCCLAGECEHSKVYHSFPTYGFLEMINSQGKWCSDEGEKGQIVATSFTNYAMPFIRYKTDDYGINTIEKCDCGRNWKLIRNIDGRLHELVVTGTGRLISMTAINMHDDVFDNIRQFQFYQKEAGVVEFKYIKKENLSQHELERIFHKLKTKFGDDVRLSMREVETIPLTMRGKHRFLIQELPIE